MHAGDCSADELVGLRAADAKRDVSFATQQIERRDRDQKLDLHAGVALVEICESRRQPAGRKTFGGSQHDPSRRGFVLGADLLLDVQNGLIEAANLLEDACPGFGEDEPVAQSVEEARPQTLLEIDDPPSDRRLGHAKRSCGSATPHYHDGFETAIYVLEGEVETRYGAGLAKSVVNKPGDFIFIPADVPHQPVNLSADEPARALVARNDADEQESVVPYDPRKSDVVPSSQ